MNLWLRLLSLFCFSWFRERCDILGPCLTPFRVLPSDLDVLGHMNNGKYLSLLDLARTDIMIRSGVLPQLIKRQWYPVLAAETIAFKSSLKLVSCPTNNMAFAAGQLALFQGANGSHAIYGTGHWMNQDPASAASP